MEERTEQWQVALEWAREIWGEGSAAQFLLSPRQFRNARRSGRSLSLTLVDTDVVGALFGDLAPEEGWSTWLVDEGSEVLMGRHRRDRWDFLSRPTSPGATTGLTDFALEGEGAIAAFLAENAPHSAVLPGDPEVIEWPTLYDEEGPVATCALTRWESGLPLLASVATRRDARRRGWAHRLVEGAVARAHELGDPWIGLGVGHDNDGARALYSAVGFAVRARFSVYP